MSIKIICPNGHRLTAKDSRAGTTGRCPACGAAIRIPSHADMAITESSIMRLLDVGEGFQPVPIPSASPTEIEEQARLDDAALGRVFANKATVKTTQICPQCDWEIDAAYRICPHCHYYLIGKMGDY